MEVIIWKSAIGGDVVCEGGRMLECADEMKAMMENTVGR